MLGHRRPDNHRFDVAAYGQARRDYTNTVPTLSVQFRIMFCDTDGLSAKLRDVALAADYLVLDAR